MVKELMTPDTKTALAACLKYLKKLRQRGHEWPTSSERVQELIAMADSALAAAPQGQGERPIVVTLCGSRRFIDEYTRLYSEESLAGRIVLTIGCINGCQIEHSQEKKDRLDALHLSKIEMSDEILVINKDSYIGESTRNEIAFAKSRGKRIRYLEPLAPPQ